MEWGKKKLEIATYSVLAFSHTCYTEFLRAGTLGYLQLDLWKNK